MAIGEIHVNDVGIQFIITLLDENGDIVDISTADLEVVFRKPGGDNVTKTGLLVNDGTDGKLYYTTVSGDLDTAGYWRLQVVTTFGTQIFHSDTYRFKVHLNL